MSDKQKKISFEYNKEHKAYLLWINGIPTRLTPDEFAALCDEMENVLQIRPE